MNRKNSAEVFAMHVDELLARRHRRDEAVVTSIEDARDLDLARRLADLDLSGESRVRETLPATLGTRVEVEPRSRRVIRFALRPITVASELLVIALVVIQCTYPGGVPALSKEVSTGISKLVQAEVRVGPSTVAQQSTGDQAAWKAAVDAIPQDVKDRIWLERVGGITFGGGTPDGMEPKASVFVTLEAARKRASFAFTTPRFTPDGVKLARVYVSPDGGEVIQEYTSPGIPSLAIAEIEVPKVFSSQSAGSASVSFVSDDPIKVTSVGESTAAWYKSGSLVWERAGISYTLGAPGVSEAEAMQIAASMK